MTNSPSCRCAIRRPSPSSPAFRTKSDSATWYLAQPDGSVAGYGTGGVQLLEAMRVTRRTGHALARLPAGFLDGTYGVIASWRSALGRLVPDRPGPRRFP